MPVPRLLAATALTLALAGGAIAFTALLDAPAHGSGTIHVAITTPTGDAYWAGDVRVENATVLRALEAAATAGGFTITVDRYPGMGAYVRAIGPYEAHGSQGWVYEVHRDGAWESGDRSAQHYGLADGAGVRWKWSADAR